MEQIWFSTGPCKNMFYDEWYRATHPLAKGDRVRIKEGYEGAGDTYYYVGKSSQVDSKVIVCLHAESDGANDLQVLAAAIEPYPYTKDERVVRAIEDYAHILNACDNCMTDDDRALLFALLDAGI